MSVRFGISEKFKYCRCRACGQTLLWFSVTVISDDGFRQPTPEVLFLQAPHESQKSYCPYCGEKELWQEDSELS